MNMFFSAIITILGLSLFETIFIISSLRIDIVWSLLGNVNSITMSALDQKDLELIERIVYKNNDDVAVSIARSFERLEERVDSSEARLHSRLSEIEDRMHAF